MKISRNTKKIKRLRAELKMALIERNRLMVREVKKGQKTLAEIGKNFKMSKQNIARIMKEKKIKVPFDADSRKYRRWKMKIVKAKTGSKYKKRRKKVDTL